MSELPDTGDLARYPDFKLDTRPQGLMAYRRLSFWVACLVDFGLRPQELRKLRHVDLEVREDAEGNAYTVAHVSMQVSKVKRMRTCISYGLTGIAHCDFLDAKKQAGLWRGRNDLIFNSPRNLDRILQIEDYFRKFLIKTNLYTNDIGQYRSSYSLRAWHITRALEQGLSIHHIAENCGTSIRMIESAYKHVRNWMNRERLLDPRILAHRRKMAGNKTYTSAQKALVKLHGQALMTDEEVAGSTD